MFQTPSLKTNPTAVFLHFYFSQLLTKTVVYHLVLEHDSYSQYKKSCKEQEEKWTPDFDSLGTFPKKKKKKPGGGLCLDEISFPPLPYCFATALQVKSTFYSTTPLSTAKKKHFSIQGNRYPFTVACGPKTPGKSMAISNHFYCEEKLA